MRGNVITLIASVIAILALAIAWHEYELTQGLVHNLGDAHQQVSQLNRQLVEAKAAGDKAKELMAQLSQQKSPTPPSQSANSNRNVQVTQLSDIIKDHPEYAELHAKDVRHRIIFQYGASLAALNLPPDQLAKVKSLLVERQLSATDAMEAARANGLVQGSPEWRTAVQQATAGTVQELDSILQTSANTSLSEFELVNNTRQSSGINLGTEMTDAGLPLTDVQALAIAKASADASFRSPNAQHPPDYNTPDPTTGLTPKQTQMINQVAPALSPAQLSLYKTALLEMMQRQTIENQYGRDPTTGMMP